MSSEKPLDVASLGVAVADTHAHLDMLDDPAAALARAAAAGVSFVITVVDPTEDADTTFGGLSAWRSEAARLIDEQDGASAPGPGHASAPSVPEVRVIVGAHPHNAKDFDDEARKRLLALSARPGVVGIGEIGLDFHYDHSPRDVQRTVFADQLAVAAQLGLPAVVHLRDAHAEGEAIMREVGLPAEGCVLHCFTGDARLAERFLDLGCYVSFAGPVTFKKADAIREAAARVPLDRLLVETDCPFMAPEPYRGRPNEPALSILTARRIAETRGIAAEELARATSLNAHRLFGGAREGRAPQ